MRTAQLHLQRSTEALLGYLQGIACDDHLSDLEIANLQGWLESHHPLRQHGPFSKVFPWNVQPGMWHSPRRITGCDFAPPGASKSAPQAGTPVDLSLDTHPAYELIDMATRQLHGVLHGIQSDGKVTEEEVYGLRDWLEHFRIFRGAWPFSDARINENAIKIGYVLGFGRHIYKPLPLRTLEEISATSFEMDKEAESPPDGLLKGGRTT